MKFVYFGTPQFSATILEKLVIAGMIPAAVVTNPDRPVGRKKILTASAVKQYSEGYLPNIEILQPEKLSEIKNRLLKIGVDFGILAAYGKIIPQEIIDIFPKGIIVVHPSLLPKYRGATPIQSTLLAGETETGTTLIIMDEKVDHGAIIGRQELRIKSQDTYETLVKSLAELSGGLLVETLPKYLSGGIAPQPQDHSQATFTKKFTIEDGYVDLEKSSPEEIWRKVRALNPEPGVWTMHESSKRLKILSADLVDRRLILSEVQFEGKKPERVRWEL